MENTPKRLQRFLVVGSWAKEEITIENLKSASDISVFAYMDTKNPGIIRRADSHQIGSLTDTKTILSYAKENDVDIVLITTAAPLKAGLADALEKGGILAFGPDRQAARLESDKAFTRSLMKKHVPDAIPDFAVFGNVKEAVDFAESLQWQVAVKPIGLTDGLGIKVFGDQLTLETDVMAYISQIHSRKIDGHSKIIIEEKLEGVEFTVQCFVFDNRILPTPAVQDFKKLHNGDKGPNTASMGSYSAPGHLLPFMIQQDYDQALSVIRRTLNAYKTETGRTCTGFLYGQFMITRKGLKLIEYNFRPGDPEWMNTVILFQENIRDIIENLIEDRQQPLRVEKCATVCKYIVPPEYPAKRNQILEVAFDETRMQDSGVDVYASYGLDENGRMNVGSERGIAFLAKADSIEEAHHRLEEAMGTVQGLFHYRSDIGSEDLLKSKIEIVNKFRKMNMNIRTAAQEDFIALHALVSECKPLEDYPEHLYKIILRYFGDTCFLLENHDRLVGFIMGVVSDTLIPKTYFLWQIGIHPSVQGEGMGKILIKEMEAGLRKAGCHRIEVTIDPENKPSQRLFDKMKYTNISASEGNTVRIDDAVAAEDYYKPGRHFMLYEKLLIEAPPREQGGEDRTGTGTL